MRRSLEETWQYLASQGEETPRRLDGQPFVHDAIPNYDDDKLGFSYFRYRLEDADNSNLTLPRAFIGRSRFLRVNFSNTDLSESRMCWNDFDQCDFSGADLSKCDMRASLFKGCRFAGAILQGADLRRSSFEDCVFENADLSGAVAENEDFEHSVFDFLSSEQIEVMSLTDDEGEEPPGS